MTSLTLMGFETVPCMPKVSETPFLIGDGETVQAAALRVKTPASSAHWDHEMVPAPAYLKMF